MRPAEAPGGFLKMQPALFCPSGWLARRFSLQIRMPVRISLVRFGGKFQLHCEHHIIGRKRSVPVFEAKSDRLESFDFARGRPVELHFADVGADLRAVGAGVHAQRAADRAGNADEPFHAAEIVLGAEGDGAAEIGGGIDLGDIAFDAHVPALEVGSCRTTQGQFAIHHEQVRAAAKEPVRNAVARRAGQRDQGSLRGV